ncbi:restriction endonuclease subunit S [Stutzerimonas stutzeri]|uniref:restriction endonuclease subunit S n=1 Tax=Stutzerimonas stutzeri TaxID=316 RepID=UPI003B78EC19
MNLVPFGSVCSLQNGRAFKPEEWSASGTPIVRIQNLNDESKPFNYCDFEVEKRFHVDSGDLLFSWSGTPGTSFGAFFWNRGKGFLNQHIFRVDIDERHIDKNYLRYAINSKLDLIIDQAHGGVGLKHITKGKLEAVEIPLPPLPEQKRIAAILDKADAIRRKRQQAIQLADDFLRAVFLDMFGDPVTNPMGWETKALADVCKKITDGTHHSPPIVDAGVPYITAKHLKKTGLQFFNDPWFISEEDHRAIYSRCAPEKNDVLYIKDGATTGLAAINEYDFEFSMLSSLALLKPCREKILPEYLTVFLNHPITKQVIIANMAGAAITRLTLAKIKSVRIPVPPIEMQQKFTDIYVKVREATMKITSGVDASVEAFEAISQKAFSGQL